MHWLDEAGGRYLELVRSQQPRFLIEIEVGQTEVETIFRKLENHRGPLDTPKERRLCIAVAAVNAAALAEQDDSSFIELFYMRMRRVDWADSWEKTHASAIWRALHENFEVELQKQGSGKYVNSIYRHSGIPVRARAKFAAFLGKLLLSGGGTFTHREYGEALSSYPNSTARTFLESQSGYNFTRYLAKWYGRRMLGTATDADLSPCWHELLNSIEQELSSSGPRLRNAAVTRSYRDPYLALNMNSEQSRLEVRFDPRGIQKRVYSVDSKRVESIYLLADDEPLEVSVRGQQPTQISPWWYPGESPFAVFRASSGALAPDPTALGSGIYWVATTLEIGAHQEISLLDGPSCSQYYRVYEFEFRPGLSIPELGIRARGGTATPALELTGSRPNNLGANLYEETPPSIRILNWEHSSARRYMLWMNDGTGDRQLPLPRAEEEEIAIPVRCPAAVEIWLEDIRNSANDVIDHVSVTVIPTVSLIVEEGTVGSDDVAHLRGNVPADWHIEWEQGIVDLGNHRWRVPAGRKVFEGQLLGSGVRVPISIRIRRVSLREESGASILWKETFANPDRKLRLEGPPDARYSLLASDNDGRRLYYPGAFDAAGVSRLSTSSFNDAVQMDAGSAVELVVQLTNGRQFPTGLFVASAACLSVAEEADLRRLPDIGATLAQYRGLNVAPEHLLDFPSELLESPLRKLAAELAYGASVFDGSQSGRDLDLLVKECSERFLRVTAWFSEASALGEMANVDAARLLKDYPDADIASLPVDRWRQTVADLRLRLRAQDEIPEEVSFWKTRILSLPGSPQRAGLESRDGGRYLTDAVRLYAQSFGWPESERRMAYTTVYRRLFRFVSSDPIIRLLAESFRRVVLYRMGGAEAELKNSLPFDFPPCFQRLRSTLDSLSGLPGSKWVNGLGLQEISPVAADAELEFVLGRPRETAAGN
jgi:hypothetical protein